MTRAKGDVTKIQSWEPLFGKNIDASKYVPTKADLTILDNWKDGQGRKNYYTGKTVEVKDDDGTPAVYQYVGAEPNTTQGDLDVVNAEKWVKLGASAGHDDTKVDKTVQSYQDTQKVDNSSTGLSLSTEGVDDPDDPTGTFRGEVKVNRTGVILSSKQNGNLISEVMAGAMYAHLKGNDGRVTAGNGGVGIVQTKPYNEREDGAAFNKGEFETRLEEFGKSIYVLSNQLAPNTQMSEADFNELTKDKYAGCKNPGSPVTYWKIYGKNDGSLDLMLDSYYLWERFSVSHSDYTIYRGTPGNNQIKGITTDITNTDEGGLSDDDFNTINSTENAIFQDNQTNIYYKVDKWLQPPDYRGAYLLHTVMYNESSESVEDRFIRVLPDHTFKKIASPNHAAVTELSADFGDTGTMTDADFSLLANKGMFQTPNGDMFTMSYFSESEISLAKIEARNEQTIGILADKTYTKYASTLITTDQVVEPSGSSTDLQAASAYTTHIRIVNEKEAREDADALLLPKTDVIAPSTTAATGKAADAKATADFVNDSISSLTATFRGNFATKAALDEYAGTKDKNDYCLPGHTEVMTDKGFKRIDEISLSDKVAQWNIEDKTINFVNPLKTISVKSDELYTFKVGYSTLSTTGNHRIPLQHSRAKRSVKNGESYTSGYIDERLTLEAKEVFELKDLSSWKTFSAGYSNVAENHLSFNERLVIAIQADGTITNQNKYGVSGYRINIKKQRKIERLDWILENLETPIYYSKNKNKGGYYSYYISNPSYKNYKLLSNAFDIKDFSVQKAKEFISEVVKWDGGEYGKEKRYLCKNKNNINFVQSVASLCGISSKVAEKISGKSSYKAGSVYYALTFYSDRFGDTIGIVPLKKEKVNDTFYCLTVPSSYFLIRTDDGFVIVTGNCVVESDETHSNEAWRYKYNGTAWVAEYKLNETPLTTAQLAALNSGATATKVGNYDSHIADTTKHVTETERTTWNGKLDKVGSGTSARVYSVTSSGTQATNKLSTTVDNDTSIPTGSAVTAALGNKQDKLVSGTNIKTVNSNSLLGSGNLTISASVPKRYFHVISLNDNVGSGSGTITNFMFPSSRSKAYTSISEIVTDMRSANLVSLDRALPANGRVEQKADRPALVHAPSTTQLTVTGATSTGATMTRNYTDSTASLAIVDTIIDIGV